MLKRTANRYMWTHSMIMGFANCVWLLTKKIEFMGSGAEGEFN